MKHFAMIDTETTWSGALMTAGVLIVEADSLKVVDSKYYIAVDALREGGLYSYEVHQKGIEEIQSSSADVGSEIHRFLTAHGVKTILAYNAGFDKNVLSYLRGYTWCDIMKLAAYKQYNSAIPEDADCFKTGKLKRGYGVECILRMLGKKGYSEIHNALTDAMDELEIVRLLGHPVDMYPEI